MVGGRACLCARLSASACMRASVCVLVGVLYLWPRVVHVNEDIRAPVPQGYPHHRDFIPPASSFHML